MMARVPDFPSLERTANRIAEHPFFPDKCMVIQECLEDIEHRFRQGELSETQRTRLIAILATG
ncbi:MAG: hypothetical protein P4L84_37765 [Isosphaeraceae bacterium]|nr:hypothetical protein [Isosphaeraceae bacterium]